MTSVMETEYNDWLLSKASTYVFPDGPYSELFTYLHSVDFYSDVQNDVNRASDGLDLREQFAGESNRWNHRDMYLYLMNRKCSVLEMMIALAMRCENDIMHDEDYDDRTGVWFRMMLENLGLLQETDDVFDIHRVEVIVSCLLERDYKRNGVGGMFPIVGIRKNMKNTEIWYQMCWYLDAMIDQLQ